MAVVDEDRKLIRFGGILGGEDKGLTISDKDIILYILIIYAPISFCWKLKLVLIRLSL